MKSCGKRGMMLVAALMLAGCASQQINRIDRNRALYESWPLDTQQMVYEGKVEPGMTPAMVEMAWGKPTEVQSRGLKAGEDETWIYRTTRDDPYASNSGMMGGTGGSGVSMGGTMGGITVGRGGISPSIGIGGGSAGTMGTGGTMGGGAMMPTPQIVEERRVEFHDGVVHHADPPPPK